MGGVIDVGYVCVDEEKVQLFEILSKNTNAANGCYSNRYICVRISNTMRMKGYLLSIQLANSSGVEFWDLEGVIHGKLKIEGGLRCEVEWASRQGGRVYSMTSSFFWLGFGIYLRRNVRGPSRTLRGRSIDCGG